MFAVTPNTQTTKLEIPKRLVERAGLAPQAPSHLAMQRKGFKLVPGVAARPSEDTRLSSTSEYRPPALRRCQALTSCSAVPQPSTTSTFSLRCGNPETSKPKPALLKQARRKFRFQDDAKAELRSLRELAAATQERHKHVELHFVDTSVDPCKCATCGAPV
eukprot:scaffold231162_cov15-Prasinocladus_malaysianus.AAC.3